MTKQLKVVHGTQPKPPGPRYSPRPKNSIDRKADAIIREQSSGKEKK
jgi:hypothetical protein